MSNPRLDDQDIARDIVLSPGLLQATYANLTGLTLKIEFGPYYHHLEPLGKLRILFKSDKWAEQMTIEGLGKFPDGTKIKKQSLGFPDTDQVVYLSYYNTFFNDMHQPVSVSVSNSEANYNPYYKATTIDYTPESSQYLNGKAKGTLVPAMLHEVMFAPSPNGDFIPPKYAYDPNVVGAVTEKDKAPTEHRLKLLGFINTKTDNQTTDNANMTILLFLFLVVIVIISLFVIGTISIIYKKMSDDNESDKFIDVTSVN
jgi:hypothetical protein